MRQKPNMNKIARALGAKRRGKVASKGGYFGALQLLADIEYRFRVPIGGGRPTNPDWTARRLVPLSPETLDRLVELSGRFQDEKNMRLDPMQLAAILLERAVRRAMDADAEDELKPKKAANE